MYPKIENTYPQKVEEQVDLCGVASASVTYHYRKHILNFTSVEREA